MNRHDEILEFIENFKKRHKETTEDIFLNGNCYWFSVILIARFTDAKPYYMPITGHFIVYIDERFYDITGEITNFAEQPVSWEKFCKADPIWADRVYKCCAQLKQ